VLGDIVVGSVCGLGWRGYVYALEGLVELLRERRARGRAPAKMTGVATRHDGARASRRTVT
jgi:hypothetical protein